MWAIDSSVIDPVCCDLFSAWAELILSAASGTTTYTKVARL